MDDQTPSAGQPADAAIGDPADLGSFDAATLAQMVASASDEQIAEGMAGENRKTILDEIFRRMREEVNADAARGQDAVVHWKILDRPEGGYDHYEVVIKDGRCEVSDSPSREPRVTLSLKPVDFIRLVTGQANGPMMFMAGKLKIEGDLMFSAQMTSIFRIPDAGAAPAGGAPQGA